MPDITIFDEKGVEIKRDSLSKGLVALHFWATWCSSCERELDSISKLTEKKISLYCISIDDDPTEAIEYLKKLNLKLPLYFDRNSVVAKRLGSSKFPETYILYNGKIILKFEGPRDWENKELIEFIYRTAYVSLTSIIK
ncbi:MAG: TlpA family protein disulfide reductase [Myxococcota bacterium]